MERFREEQEKDMGGAQVPTLLSPLDSDLERPPFTGPAICLIPSPSFLTLLLQKQTKGEMEKTKERFRELHSFLNEQEKLLLAQLEEVEKEIARKREEHLARLSEELSSLGGLIREMEEKCQQPPEELLQVRLAEGS